MATPDATITLELNAGAANAQLAKFGSNLEHAGAVAGKSMHGAGEHAEHLLASTHRVAGQMGKVSGALLSGGNAADVFSASLEGVEHSLHLPLGALAGMSIGAVLAEKIGEAVLKAKELNAEVYKLTRDQGPSEFRTTGAIEAEVKELADKIEEIKKLPHLGDHRSGFQETLSDPSGIAASPVMFPKEFGKGFLEGGGIGALGPAVVMGLTRSYEAIKKQRADQIADLRKQQAQGIGDLSEKTGDDTSVISIRLNVGEFAAQRAEIQKKMMEETGANARNPDFAGSDPALVIKLNEEVKARAAVEMETVDRKEAAQQRSIDLEKNLTEIKKAGADVEVKSAAARVAAAQSDLQAAPDDEKAASQNKVDAAVAELDLARRTRTEKLAQIDAETRIANLAGPELAVKRETLAIEKQLLEAKLARAQPDDRPGIELDLARNAQAQIQQGRAESDSSDDVLNSQMMVATTGPTDDEKRQRIENRKANELLDPKRVGGPDEAEAGKHLEKVADLKQSLEDMSFTQGQSLDQERATTDEIEKQASGQGELAGLMKLRADYAEKIAEATRVYGAASEQVLLLQRQQTAAETERQYRIDDQLGKAAETTNELQLQADGYATLAEQARIVAEYEEKIKEARHEGNDALADELQKQESLALLTSQAETYLKGPKARREEQKHARDLRHAEDVVTARNNDAADREKRRGGGDGIADHDWSDFENAFPKPSLPQPPQPIVRPTDFPAVPAPPDIVPRPQAPMFDADKIRDGAPGAGHAADPSKVSSMTVGTLTVAHFTINQT
jgi:hypothetical protein